MKRRVLKKRWARRRNELVRDVYRAMGSHTRWSRAGYMANRPWLYHAVLVPSASSVVASYIVYSRGAAACSKR